MIFIDFHWFLLIFIDFHWFPKHLYMKNIPTSNPEAKTSPMEFFHKRNDDPRTTFRNLEIHNFHWFRLIFIEIQRFSWIFIDFHWFPWIFIDFHWFPIDFHWFSLISIDFIDFYCFIKIIDFHWFSLISIDFHWFSLIS